jgi:hypothetical protein
MCEIGYMSCSEYVEISDGFSLGMQLDIMRLCSWFLRIKLRRSQM